MAIIAEILQKVGLKYEDLTTAERNTLMEWNRSLQTKQLTIDAIKNHIHAMRFAVERELTETGHNSKQDLFLKARLRNYMLLEAFMDSPEKAKEALDKALSGLVSTKEA